MEKIKRFFYHHWLIITLTIIGAFLRLYRLESTLQFLGDQGRDAIILRNLIVNHDLPFIGPITSVGGFFLGPLYYYLMAPFLWLSNFNPIGPAYATAFIGIITIPALYQVTKKMLSDSAAKYATILYTLGSVPIIETRGAWNPNPMPLASLGMVFGFYQALKTKNKNWVIFSAVCLGSALQFHYMIVFLSPFILWQIILILREKSLRKSVLFWFLTILLLMLPLILFEFKNNFINFQGLLEYLGKSENTESNFWQVIKDTKGRSEQAIGMLLGFGEAYSVLRVWLTRLIWLPAVYLLFKKPSRGYLTVFFWIFLSIIAISFYHGQIPPYYLSFLFPAVFMLTGYLLSKLKGKLIIFGLGFIVLFLSFNLPKTFSDLHSSGNLNSVKQTARFIKDDVDKNNYSQYNLVLLDGTKDYRASSFRYFLEVFGGQPLSIANYPSAQQLYIISPYPQANVLDEMIWEIDSIKPAQLIESWEFEKSENIYKIERL